MLETFSCIFFRHLGFDYGFKTIKSTFGNVPSKFAMDEVACSSTDQTLQDCSYNDETTEDCGQGEGAGVNCYSYDSSGTYSSWTDCTCAVEQITQSRTWYCDDPASSECPGSHVEVRNCTREDCPVRLVGGNGVSSGNVFAINVNDFYGPVCDNFWTNTAATVVCK